MKRDSNAKDCSAGNIFQTDEGDATILGEAQWSWLEQQLKEPATLHIFVSGIQVIPDEHCSKRWGGFLHERIRLVKLLFQTKERSMILSSEAHLAEISRFRSTID